MTPCREIRKRLNQLLDAGETRLPDFVADHLDECSDCRHWWKQTRRVEGALREGEAAQPAPASLYRRVRSALDEEPAPSRSDGRLRLVRWGWAAVAAVVVGIVGISLLLNVQESTRLGPAHHANRNPNPPSWSDLPQLSSFEALVSVPQPVIEVRQDFNWLTNALVSNAQSAARAVAPVRGRTPLPHPTRTSRAPIES